MEFSRRLSLGPPDRLHTSISKESGPGLPRQWRVGLCCVTHRFNEVVSVPPEVRLRIRFQCAALGQRHTKRAVDVRNDALVRFLEPAMCADVFSALGPKTSRAKSAVIEV